VQELSEALGVLRAARDPRPIRAFFARYEAACRDAERAEPLRIARREWQDTWLEVKDLLASRMPRLAAPSRANDVIIRKLGWLKLNRELARAWALLRVGAPEAIVLQQKKRVRAAYLATGWDDEHAPAPPALPDFDFWLDPQASEQQAWAHAEELNERGVAMCIPPLAEPLALGESIRVAGTGRKLVDDAVPPCAGWVEPSNSPRFVVGRDALGIDTTLSADDGVQPERLEAARALLARAAELAASEGRALIWWYAR
jgi:hypothetical protein